MIKRACTAMISILLACGGVALAQTYSQPTPPPSSQQPPAESSQAPSGSSSGSSSSGSSSMSMSQKHEALKECVAQQQANNSGMSKKDAKKACKAQMKSQG